MFTRLIFRKPFQVGRAAMAYLLSAQEPVKKYDVERRTRRTRSKTLSIFLCGFSGFCVVRDFFTRSEAFALRRRTHPTYLTHATDATHPTCPTHSTCLQRRSKMKDDRRVDGTGHRHQR